MEKTQRNILVVYAILLILFAVFSTKISFHDAPEYITIAKYLAGVDNVDLFSAHSLIYPLIISIFLKIWPSVIMLKLINVVWIFLIAISLLLYTKNNKIFLLFVLCPLAWQTSIQTTPILPASFFFLLSYILFKKTDIKHHFAYSGLFAGISFAFYTPMVIVSGIFLLVYFWNKTFKEFLSYLLSFVIGFLPCIIQDYYLFKMPFYSLIRYFGANVLISLGVRASRNFGIIHEPLIFVPLIIVISPFLFKIYKLNIREYHKEILFVILATLFFFIRIYELKYFLILTPIILIILSDCISKKEMKLNVILSIIVIILFTWSFFVPNEETLITSDLNKISQNYDADYILTLDYQANNFAIFSWQNTPRFLWQQDYESSIKNETLMKSYAIGINSKVPLREDLNILFNFDGANKRDYPSEKVILIVKKTDEERIKKIEANENLKDFKLKECYEILCVYKK